MMAKTVVLALGVVMLAFIGRFLMWFIHWTSFGRDRVWPWLNDLLDKIVVAADAKSVLTTLLVPLLCLALMTVVFMVVHYVGVGIRWMLGGLVTDHLAGSLRSSFRSFVVYVMRVTAGMQLAMAGFVSLLSAHMAWAGQMQTAFLYLIIVVSLSAVMGWLLDGIEGKPLHVKLWRSKSATT